jgi:hypothetical protein
MAQTFKRVFSFAPFSAYAPREQKEGAGGELEAPPQT